MVGKCVFVLAISLFLTSSAQTCKNQTLADNKVFTKCRDLPYLTSYLHWNYDQGTGKLDMAFRHAGIDATNRWVAWANNPNNDLDSAMVGAQALVAVAPPSGPLKLYTCPIGGYGTELEEGNISYATSDLSAIRPNSNEITIYATLTLPIGTTNLVHLWQDGPLSGSTPEAHVEDGSNLQAKENLDLV